MRGRPFQKGICPNPGGRPREVGYVRELAREHTALAVGTLVSVTKNPKSPAAARVAAATAILDRGYGRPGPTSVRFVLPDLCSLGDAAPAMAAIAKGVASAELTPGEAAELSRLVEAYIKVLETTDFDQRLRELEEGKVREPNP